MFTVTSGSGSGSGSGSESGPAGAGPGSSGAPSPPGEESRSLESLESFSNLHSGCPSSSELNSDAEEAAAAEAAPGGPAPEPGGERPAAGAQLLPASKERFPGQSVYHIKWVRWKEENTPVITQNENGPCPLLAIMNVLLLAWKVAGLRALGGAGWGLGAGGTDRAPPAACAQPLLLPARTELGNEAQELRAGSVLPGRCSGGAGTRGLTGLLPQWRSQSLGGAFLNAVLLAGVSGFLGNISRHSTENLGNVFGRLILKRGVCRI